MRYVFTSRASVGYGRGYLGEKTPVTSKVYRINSAA
jgi:hypothetical protein